MLREPYKRIHAFSLVPMTKLKKKKITQHSATPILLFRFSNSQFSCLVKDGGCNSDFTENLHAAKKPEPWREEACVDFPHALSYSGKVTPPSHCVLGYETKLGPSSPCLEDGRFPGEILPEPNTNLRLM